MIVAVLFAVVLGSVAADDCHVYQWDVWFGDLYNYMAPSFAACKERCRTDSRCRAVVYYHWGALTGKCHLKNGAHGGRIHCAWCTSAFKPCIDQEGPCPAGQYKASRLSCANCPANTYSGAGASRCTPCPAGRYSGARASSCAACPAGTARTADLSKCMACPANTYSEAGSARCIPCPAGFSAASGAASCEACPAGSYRNASTADCQACPANTFSNVTGAVECEPCGDGYISPNGSTSADMCEAVNGEHCWALYDNARMKDVYGDKMTYEEANPLCFKDDKCTAVTCVRRKGRADDCTLSSGTEHVAARKKSYVYLKEC